MKRDFESYFLFVGRMQYLAIALITGLRIFSQIELSELNCRILKLLITFEKKSFNSFTVFLSSFLVLFPSINVVPSLSQNGKIATFIIKCNNLGETLIAVHNILFNLIWPCLF